MVLLSSSIKTREAVSDWVMDARYINLATSQSTRTRFLPSFKGDTNPISRKYAFTKLQYHQEPASRTRKHSQSSWSRRTRLLRVRNRRSRWEESMRRHSRTSHSKCKQDSILTKGHARECVSLFLLSRLSIASSTLGPEHCHAPATTCRTFSTTVSHHVKDIGLSTGFLTRSPVSVIGTWFTRMGFAVSWFSGHLNS